MSGFEGIDVAAVWSVIRTAGLVLLGGLAVVVLLLNLVVGRWLKGQELRLGGSVTGIVGKMGAGKSYAAVRIAENRLRRGVDVCSNFEMHLDSDRYPGKWEPFRGWDQFAELRDCVVIIDEAHTYAPSHQHIRFPMIARWALAHARKHGVDVFWISQHEDRVNRSLRDLTTSMVLTEAWLGGKFFRVREWEPEDFRKPRKELSKRWFWRRDQISQLYSTGQAIEVDEYALQGDKSAQRVREVEQLDRERQQAKDADQRPAPQHRDQVAS